MLNYVDELSSPSLLHGCESVLSRGFSTYGALFLDVQPLGQKTAVPKVCNLQRGLVSDSSSVLFLYALYVSSSIQSFIYSPSIEHLQCDWHAF